MLQARRYAFIQRLFRRRTARIPVCARLRGEIFQHQLAGEGGRRRSRSLKSVRRGSPGREAVFARQIHVCDTRRPPHILIFYIGGVRPLHDAHAKQVVAEVLPRD